MPIYSYGGFQLHNPQSGYYLLAKDLNFLTYKPTIVPLARRDGLKTTGYQLSERTLQIDVRIVGASRLDAMNKKDALEAALTLQNQALTLHEDGRYLIASATTATGKFAAGTGINQVDVPITFTAQDPLFYALTQSTWGSGAIAYSQVGSVYVSPQFVIASGGSFYSYPTIHVANTTPSLFTIALASTLNQGSTYTSLSLASPLPVTLVLGTTLLLLPLSYTAGSIGIPAFQQVVVSSTTAASSTSIPVTSFVASATFPSASASVNSSVAWNSMQVAQLNDGRVLNVTALPSVPLPLVTGDYIDVTCDPTASNGWSVTTNGRSAASTPAGPFPVLQPTPTAWQITIGADTQPVIDAQWTWTARWTS